MGLLDNELFTTKEALKKTQNKELTDDRAFSYVLMNHFFYDNKRDFSDIELQITDGTNDGGIDFVYYDEEDMKVFVCQSKHTKTFDTKTAISEINQMITTVKNFQIGQTGIYNCKLKEVLQNALDRLPDEAEGNIEYCVYNSSEFDEQEFLDKVVIKTSDSIKEAISIFGLDNIEKRIEDNITNIETVENDSIRIDKPKNILVYENDNIKGIMVNLASSSLISLFNKYESKGLFELNIRRYIKNKAVDTGINHTLNNNRNDFWFLNNGVIIACKDFFVDGDKIVLTNFSIVNGGQTTTLIGRYKGKNTQNFYIPCKIICQKNDDNTLDFFNSIAEATNSQKPIFQRDIRSNSPEMKRLKKMLEENGIFVEIKRGDNKNSKRYSYRIKNDELGQLIFSFVFQRPGTSRSGKKTIFENNSFYNQIFRQNYDKEINKKLFLIDLVNLNVRYSNLENEVFQSLAVDERIVYKNGKQIIFALFGIVYSIFNKDIDVSSYIQNKDLIRNCTFNYDKFLSNYHGDDIDDKLKTLIITIVQIITEKYNKCYENSECTSVSNFFKTDKKYYDEIVDAFLKDYNRSKAIKSNIDECGVIFQR